MTLGDLIIYVIILDEKTLLGFFSSDKKTCNNEKAIINI